MNLNEMDRELMLAAGIDPDGETSQCASVNAYSCDALIEQLVRTRHGRMSQEQVAAAANRSLGWVQRFETLGTDHYMSEVRRYATAIGAKFSFVVIP